MSKGKTGGRAPARTHMGGETFRPYWRRNERRVMSPISTRANNRRRLVRYSGCGPGRRKTFYCGGCSASRCIVKQFEGYRFCVFDQTRRQRGCLVSGKDFDQRDCRDTSLPECGWPHSLRLRAGRALQGPHPRSDPCDRTKHGFRGFVCERGQPSRFTSDRRTRSDIGPGNRPRRS